MFCGGTAMRTACAELDLPCGTATATHSSSICGGGAERGHAAQRTQLLSLIPALLMIFAYFTISPLIVAPNCSGVPPRG